MKDVASSRAVQRGLEVRRGRRKGPGDGGGDAGTAAAAELDGGDDGTRGANVTAVHTTAIELPRWSARGSRGRTSGHGQEQRTPLPWERARGPAPGAEGNAAALT